ncbi:MAG: protein-disulfide reductase DsbD N-terminal domain-containing protein [Chromatiales bacterium]|nr:protein-disulfide reductase DsbD N-terminal domain-containing protein [Chromatiales bacterium]
MAVRARDANTIEASWKIADGYYMYRDKFRFESLDPALIAEGGRASRPARRRMTRGFGVVETYTQDGDRSRVPIDAPPTGATTARLRITYAGLQRAGRRVLPAGWSKSRLHRGAAARRSRPPPAAGTARSRTWRSSSARRQPSGIPAAGAGVRAVQRRARDDADAVAARIEVADGYYLYRDKIEGWRRRRRARRRAPRHDRSCRAARSRTTRSSASTEVYVRARHALPIPLAARRGGRRHRSSRSSYQGCAGAGGHLLPAGHGSASSLRLPAAG